MRRFCVTNYLKTAIVATLAEAEAGNFLSKMQKNSQLFKLPGTHLFRHNYYTYRYINTVQLDSLGVWIDNFETMCKTLTGNTRTAFLFFFASHIPATLCIDLQALFPAFYPQALKDLLHFYTELFNDDLMRGPHETWFRSLLVGELVLQLPFFIVAVYVLLNTEKFSGRGWFRSMCMIYGTHTATTLLPILACHCENGDATLMQKAMVIGIYLPYLFFPLWLLYIAFVSEDVFGRSIEKKKD